MNSELDAAQIKAMKVSNLKAALSSRGLPTNGVKAALQKRLLEAVQAAAAEAASNTMETDDNDDLNGEGVVDETVRLKGTVEKYEYRRGFGLIKPEDGGKLVYVHWKQIQSTDAWPSLTKDMEVEYYLGKRNRKRGKKTMEQIFAAKVTLSGGVSVSVSQGDLKKTYPNTAKRFAGTVKFFRVRDGYGFIQPKEDFEFEGESFKADDACIYIAREDIQTEEQSAPSFKSGADVEFTLYKRENAKKWGAGYVTKPGGEKVTADDFGKMPPKQRRNQGFGPVKGGKVFNMGGQKFQMVPMMNMMNPMMAMMGGMGGNPYNKKKKGGKKNLFWGSKW